MFLSKLLADDEETSHLQNEMPQTPLMELLKRLYPYDIMMSKEGRGSVEDALKVYFCSHFIDTVFM